MLVKLNHFHRFFSSMLQSFETHPLAALDRGWIPNYNLNDDRVKYACAREDKGEFKCILKRGQLEKTIKTAVLFILEQEGQMNNTEATSILNLTGPNLDTAAGPLIESYFDQYRHTGITCDFGGIAMLVEQNRTITNEDPLAYQYDEYIRYVQRGPPLWVLIVAGIAIAIIAGLAGFVVAMRRNPTFNRRVRSNPLFMSMARSSGDLLRSSLNIPALGEEYEEIIKDSDSRRGPLSW